MQVTMFSGTVAALEQLAEKTIIVRLNQRKNRLVGRKWVKFLAEPIPIWFMNSDATMLLREVKVGDGISVSCEVQAKENNVSLIALSYEASCADVG
jgi:hypothetical protein